MKSWDCFDTLIARRYVYPVTVWKEVSSRLGILDFIEQRKAASKKSNGTYYDIYKNLPKIDPSVELAVELEHSYPIIENINQVNDGDYIISDMHLPKEHIKIMLEKCGLKKDVNLIVTPKGKKKGYIWNEIQKDQIEIHIGDNEKTDYLSPLTHGVNAILYTNSNFTEIEKEIYINNPNLAAWMRFVRLQCPYQDPSAKKYWLDQANGNLPMLALATLELPEKTIAFTYRDCNIWHPLYEKITGKKAKKLLSSRTMYKQQSNNYFREYVNNIIFDSVIVDIYGSGKRIEKFFKNNPPETYYLTGNTKNFVFNISSCRGNKSLEKHNCSTELSLVDFNANGPIFGGHRHPSDVASIQQECANIAINSIVYYPFEKNLIDLKVLIEEMCKESNFTNQIDTDNWI
jgi:hypothetical protein